MRKKSSWLFFILIIGLGALLRFWNYAQVPSVGETKDENAWTLLGASLIQEQAPASWSYFDAYQGYEYKTDVYEAPIVKPVLDHPPLFSLLPGAAHSLKNYWLDYPSIKLIRAPLVLLGIVNLILFYFVAQKLFKRPWSVLVSLIYATAPLIVFSSRLVVAENLLITWVLVATYLVADKKIKNRFYWLVVVAVLAVLTKVSGIILPISLVLYGLLAKNRDIARAGFWGGLIGIGLFAVYGAWYNWELFLKLLSSQSSRRLGLATLQNRLFLNPAIIGKVYFDGWKILGLISTIYLLAKGKKKYLFINLVTLMTLLFVLTSAGEQTLHGWYDYVMYPSLILSIAGLLKVAWEEKYGLLMGVLWLILLPVVRWGLLGLGIYQSIGGMELRVIMGLGFIPLALNMFSIKSWKKPVSWLLVAIILMANVATILKMNNIIYWENDEYFSPSMRVK